jgi:hypothetical protein
MSAGRRKANMRMVDVRRRFRASDGRKHSCICRPCRIDDNSAGKAQAVEMRNGGGNIDEADFAVYAELEPVDRHRPLVDHLFVLRDCGRLTGVGRNLFASPFSELALVARRQDDGRDNDPAITWKALHLPPRFGRQPRQRSFHGWMCGIRCRPLDPDTADVARVDRAGDR